MDFPGESLSQLHRGGRQHEASDDGSRRHWPIIVRLASYRFRRFVFNIKKRLKGSGVMLKEDLTVVRQRLY